MVSFKRFLIVLSLATPFLSACEFNYGVPPAKRPDEGKAPTPNESKDPNDWDLPQIKYPAMAVFEGGKWDENAETQRTPMWRLYLCMSKNSASTTGRIDINPGALGTPYKQTIYPARAGAGTTTKLLSLVRFNYSYDSGVRNFRDQTYWGQTNLNVASVQTWDNIISDPNSPGEAVDIDVFNLRWTADTLSGGKFFAYNTDDQSYYFQSTVDHFYFDRDKKIKHVLTRCEERNVPNFILLKDEIPKN